VSRRRLPRRTLGLLGANALAASVQGQLQFVLPWILLARGHSPRAAALATAFVYVPLLLTAVPAGAVSDHFDPLRLMRWTTVGSLAACLLFPLASLMGSEAFWLVLAAAAVVGGLRNFSEGAVFRGLANTTRDDGLLHAHAVRTTVNQAAIFGSPFVGLLLFHAGGTEAVMAGFCVLLAAALGVLALVPALGHEPDPDSVMRDNVADGMASLRANSQLRKIGWANLSWNVFAGAAMGIMPAVLREHVGMNELTASATFVAGVVVVVALTIPLVRAAQNRVGAISTFILAIAVQGTAVLLFADERAAILAPLTYCLFLLSNSAAAASLNGARAAEVEHDHQGLLNMALLTVGMVGFILGVLLAATLLGPLGFGAVLVLIGAGMAATAAGFRRPLMTG
jgi:MFS family permease